MADLKAMRARAEYYKSMDQSHIDCILLDEYFALIICAEALEDCAQSLGDHLPHNSPPQPHDFDRAALTKARTALAQLEQAP